MSDVAENRENVGNIDEPSFLSVMDLVDDNLHVDKVDEVLEDDDFMDLEEAEDLVRQRAEEARLCARAWYPVLGIKVPILLTWLAGYSFLLLGFCSIYLSLCYSIGSC